MGGARMNRLGAGAALGLLLALASLSTPAPAAPGKAPARTPAVHDSNRVLVRIGKETVTRAELDRRIADLPEQVRANYSTPDGRKQLLDRVIEEKVWLQAATKKGVPERPAVKRQLEQQRRDLLIRTYVTEVMAQNPAPSDSEAKVYYDSHAADYRIPATVTVRHIQSKTEADAKRLLGWSRQPKQDWNKLVQRYSTDTLTRASGGMLGTVTRDGVFSSIGAQPALADSAFRLGAGKIGGPYRTERGWHVIKVDAVKPESTRPFEQVRSGIMRQLGSQTAQDYYKTQLGVARASVGVKADSAAIESFLAQKKSARDMFQEAQNAGGATQRIDLYRKLLDEYPESEVSPQAQFMVGFIYSEELKNYDEAEKAFKQLLKRYPESELAASAQWMVEHMRTEEAPNFINAQADSSRRGVPPKGRKGSGGGRP
jgi:peptidyl-prolyl cis-trans isomerase C